MRGKPRFWAKLFMNYFLPPSCFIISSPNKFVRRPRLPTGPRITGRSPNAGRPGFKQGTPHFPAAKPAAGVRDPDRPILSIQTPQGEPTRVHVQWLHRNCPFPILPTDETRAISDALAFQAPDFLKISDVVSNKCICVVGSVVALMIIMFPVSLAFLGILMELKPMFL